MQIRKNALKISLLISFVHCVLGNLIAINITNNTFLDAIFMPYTFIGGLSQFAGWDLFSITLEILSFILMVAIFYPIGLILKKD
jgi:hypothetical protein